METPLHKLVAAKVGQYEGAYSTLKVAPEITPAKLPSPTKAPVLAALEDSDKSLLLCLKHRQQCTELPQALVGLTMNELARMECKRLMP